MDSGFPEPTPDVPVRSKRGRKSQAPNPEEGPVARFAHELCMLKRAAGDPSYDRMRSELGAAASKSALSAAARGQTLPSWETTWEFVRCLAVVKLGMEEQATKNEWLARWEQASRDDAGDTAPPVLPAEPAPEELGRTAPAEPERTEQPEPVETTSAPNRRQAVWAAILVAVLSTVLVGLIIAQNAMRSPAGDAPDYPIPGDNSGFGSNGTDGDVTVPDGTRFTVGQQFVKTWRLNNTGSVRWDNRFLQAFGDTTHTCASQERVPIPRTEPGELVDVSVRVTAKRVGHCRVEWKMVDSKGHLFFPSDKRPVYYEVIIDPPAGHPQ